MAHSAISFDGKLTLSGTTSGEITFNFTPPSNLQDKLCYIEVKGFDMMWDTEYTNPKSYHTFKLSSSWMQPQGIDVQSTYQRPNAIIASKTYGGLLNSYPVLVNIPSGPQNVRFMVERCDGGNISASANSVIDICILISAVAANSRQTPMQ